MDTKKILYDVVDETYKKISDVEVRETEFNKIYQGV